MSTLKFDTIEEAMAYIKTQGAELITANKSVTSLTTALEKSEGLLKTANDSVTALNSELTLLKEKVLTDGASYKSLEESIVGLKNQITTAEEERDSALEEISVISSKLDLQAKHGSDGTIVTIDKKSFKLSGNRFITKEGEKNAEEVSKDSDYLNHLLKIKSGVLTPID